MALHHHAVGELIESPMLSDVQEISALCRSAGYDGERVAGMDQVS